MFKMNGPSLHEGTDKHRKAVEAKRAAEIKVQQANLENDSPTKFWTKAASVASGDSQAASGVSKAVKSQAKKEAVKQGVKKGVGRLAGAAAGGAAATAVGAIGLGIAAKKAYESGQKHSGGRVGYEKNPNYDPNKPGDKHGGKDSNAQFVPTEGRKHEKSVWEKGKEKTGGGVWGSRKSLKDGSKKNKKDTKEKSGWNFNKKN